MKRRFHGLFLVIMGLLFVGCPNPIVDTPADQAVALLAIPGVVAPARAAIPVTTAIDTAQYTGTITWAPGDNPFAATTVYTADIVLTAKAGWTMTGVTANSFTVAGSTATNAVNSGTVAAVFPATGAAAIPVTGVSLNRFNTTLVTATTEQLVETIAPADASNTAVTWSSDADAVATVNSTGLVTAVAPGSAAITVETMDGNFTASCNVTVISSAYAVTFNANGGTGSMADHPFSSGQTANLTANSFTRSSYLFSGWATTPTGGIAYNDEQSYTMGSSNVTLYAVWTLSASLRVEYTFNGQDCTDSSGNNINGTAYNITYVSDGNGGYSASFNGSSSYIALPNDTVKNESDFTIMMRFKATSGQYGSLFGYQNTAVGGVTTEFIPMILTPA